MTNALVWTMGQDAERDARRRRRYAPARPAGTRSLVSFRFVRSYCLFFCIRRMQIVMSFNFVQELAPDARAFYDQLMAFKANAV
jgi:hypothetical protein